MAISQINKFHIFGHLSLKDELLKKLQKTGCTEIIEIGKKTAFHDWKDFDDQSDSDVFKDLSKVKFCIDILSPFKIKEKSGIKAMMEKKETIDFQSLKSIHLKNDFNQLYNQLKKIDDELNQIKLQENRLKSIELELRKWDQLELDISKKDISQNIGYILGTIINTDLGKIEQELEKSFKAFYFHRVQEDKKSTNIVVLSPKEDIEKIQNTLQKYRFEVYKYTHSMQGTPMQILDEISQQYKMILSQKETISKELTELNKKNAFIYPLYDYFSINKEKEEVNKYLKKSDHSFVIKGWVQKKDNPRLLKLLETNFKNTEIYFSEPKENEQIPIVLKNHKLIEPFEVITELYSLPNYHEVDPTPILSIFYFIFFGLCLSDVGYGAMMAILSYFAMAKLDLGKAAKKFFKLLYYCGIAGAIGGIIVGSWFGDILDYLPPAFLGLRNILMQKLALFDPTENPIPLLILSLFLGIMQVYTGLIMKFLDNVKNKKIVDGILDQITWLVFLTGIILVLLQGSLPGILKKIAWVIMLSGAVSLVLTQGRSNSNIIKRLGSGLLSLYNVTGYFSDVLSYSRLFALGLATGIIAKMFNMLATMANVPYIGFFITLIVLFIGHTFNLVISGLSAFIHDARLQYVEFFTKFYQAGGIAFKPFKYKTTYVKLKEN